jgi:hypothetical protein
MTQRRMKKEMSRDTPRKKTRNSENKKRKNTSTPLNNLWPMLKNRIPALRSSRRKPKI